MTPGRKHALMAALAAEIAAVICFAVVYRPFDLHVYLWGGHAVAGDARLYLDQVDQHWFTYPPFAAVLMAPLAALPDMLARVGWELATVAALAWSCLITLRLAGRERPSRLTVAAVLAGALTLEPMYHTLFLGQVNLLLLALILTDVWLLTRGRRPGTGGGAGSGEWSRWLAGAGVGAAAAIKLTPAIFIVWLLLARRPRAALTAAATFACCGLVGYLVAPAASWLYWTQLFDNTGRVSGSYLSNQSPYGMLSRVLGGVTHVGAWYIIIPLVIGVAGLAVAAVLAWRGDWLGGATVTGVTGLLVSPISWTHHWVWILPALFVLARHGRRGRVAAGCAYALFVLGLPWLTPHSGGPREYGWHGLMTVAANSYLLAGLAFLAYMGTRVVLDARRPAPVLRAGRGEPLQPPAPAVPPAPPAPAVPVGLRASVVPAALRASAVLAALPASAVPAALPASAVPAAPLAPAVPAAPLAPAVPAALPAPGAPAVSAAPAAPVFRADSASLTASPAPAAARS